MKLTDTQLVILQSGARDPERLCSAGAKLGAAPRGAIARKLISLGLAEAVPARADAPAEQRFPSSDKAGAAPMLLRITDAGLRAIGIERKKEPIPARDSAEERPAQVANVPRSGRAFWRAAEEAAARGEIPPAPDLSAPTHAPYRRKFERLVELAKAGDAAGLRAVAINPISTSPKALARWRDLAVRAIETREAGR